MNYHNAAQHPSPALPRAFGLPLGLGSWRLITFGKDVDIRYLAISPLVREYFYDFAKVPSDVGICMRGLMIQARAKASPKLFNGIFLHLWNDSSRPPHDGFVRDNVLADILPHFLSRDTVLL
jgi:hypothetical protein